MTQATQSAGLTPRYLQKLRILSREPLSARGMADRLGCTYESAKKDMRRMQDEGLLDDFDRYGTRYWTISRSGRDSLSQAMPDATG